MAEVVQQKVSDIRPFRVNVPEAELTDLRTWTGSVPSAIAGGSDCVQPRRSHGNKS